MYKTPFLPFLLYLIHIDSNMFYNTDFRSFVLDLAVKKYRSHINSFSSFLWKYTFYTLNKQRSSYGFADPFPRGNKQTSVLLKYRSTKKYQEVPRSTKKYQEVQRSTKKYQEVRRITKKYQEVRRITKKYQELPRSTENYQEVPRSTENYQEVPRITKKYQEVR